MIKGSNKKKLSPQAGMKLKWKLSALRWTIQNVSPSIQSYRPL